MKYTRKYSLWLELDKEQAIFYNSTIELLSKKYDCPTFQAHITLLGGIYGEENIVLNQFEKLKPYLKSFSLKLLELEFGNTYFQSIFYTVEKNQPLKVLRQLAENIFNKKETYFPHLSMLYGHFALSQKEEISKQISQPLYNQLMISKIALVDTTEMINDWKTLLTLSL